ncbi:MAG: cytochrome b/b6 domain-containing protein, partial [Candidatus Tectomicrobia bacterium]|nr:cytochrome b/b6 domain-containing protein [Candidatus Tectomicrobia bacterium]
MRPPFHRVAKDGIKGWLFGVVMLLALGWGSTQAEEKACLDCHGKKGILQEAGGKRAGLYIRPQAFEESAHESVDCVECHPDAEKEASGEPTAGETGPGQRAPASPFQSPHAGPLRALPCRSCHEEVEPLYTRSAHQKRNATGKKPVAGCQDCHGEVHTLLAAEEPRSKVYRSAIPQTCGACHGERFVVEKAGLSTRPFFSYQKSVHGEAVKAGSLKAAVCTDCHNSHDIEPPSSTRSPIFHFNIPRTCGRCHAAIQRVYDGSIHGQAVARGISQSPVCTDCHGIHLIKAHIDPTSSVAAQAIARTTCPQCHEGGRLSEECGVAGGRVSSYLDSYHGLAGRLGSKTAANCASCHGVHGILPSTHPASTIAPRNLSRTCGRCHPGANANFTLGKVHLLPEEAQDIGARLVGWVARIYLPLIGLVLGAMLLHNFLDFRKKLSLRWAHWGPTLVRLSRQQRAQHLILMGSFFALALSGFALKFPDSGFAWVLGSSELVRRVIHRVAAFFLTFLALYHLGYVALTGEGREVIRDLRFRIRDLRDLVRKLRYDLRKNGERPKFGRFNYVEKSEYWAAVWGIVVMMITGFVLWFETEAMVFLPRWGIDVAEAIHYYEALLATLAVVVWHLYHVIFNPEVYPMNWSWWDG